MRTTSPGTIRELGDTDRTVADPAADIRGRVVVDRNGAGLGRIDDLLIDDGSDRVLFLRVAEGGFLGLGATHYLLPIEAVVAVHPDRVVVDQEHGAVDVPLYDPELVPLPAVYGNVYGWWGVPPAWAAHLR